VYTHFFPEGASEDLINKRKQRT